MLFHHRLWPACPRTRSASLCINDRRRGSAHGAYDRQWSSYCELRPSRVLTIPDIKNPMSLDEDPIPYRFRFIFAKDELTLKVCFHEV